MNPNEPVQPLAAAPTEPPEAVKPVGKSPEPMPVVKVFSTRGVEYFLMFLALGVSALSLGSVLHNLIDRQFGLGGNIFVNQLYSYAMASLIVAFPIFTVLFLRLKKAEIANPALKNDASRHRCVQLTLIITFLIGVQKLISYVHGLLNSGKNTVAYSYYSSGLDGGSALGNFLDLMVTVVIAGGIFAYFWLEGHTKKNLG